MEDIRIECLPDHPQTYQGSPPFKVNRLVIVFHDLTFSVHSPRVKSFEKRSSMVAWYLVCNKENILRGAASSGQLKQKQICEIVSIALLSILSATQRESVPPVISECLKESQGQFSQVV